MQVDDNIYPIQTNWLVITGAPSSGKTTIIDSLHGRGFFICKDPAREIIEIYLNNSKCIDEYSKQLLIVEKMLSHYSAFSKNDLVFLEYGMPDNLVFQSLSGFQLETAKMASRVIRYKEVFLLETLPYKEDGIRNIDVAKQNIIYDNIKLKYEEYGYKPIIIPASNVAARLNKIRSHLKEAM
jgi:predicted ATPase